MKGIQACGRNDAPPLSRVPKTKHDRQSDWSQPIADMKGGTVAPHINRNLQGVDFPNGTVRL